MITGGFASRLDRTKSDHRSGRSEFHCIPFIGQILLDSLEHRSVPAFGQSFKGGCLHYPAFVARRSDQCLGRRWVGVLGQYLGGGRTDWFGSCRRDACDEIRPFPAFRSPFRTS
jgi:hypothetical protein